MNDCLHFIAICSSLTHWSRVTHLCVSKLTSTASDNGLSPGRRQAIIWTNARILLTGHIGTYFSEILIEILIFSFMKMRLKVSSGKWRPFCLGLNALSFIHRKWMQHIKWHTYTTYTEGIISPWHTSAQTVMDKSGCRKTHSLKGGAAVAIATTQNTFSVKYMWLKSGCYICCLIQRTSFCWIH